MTFRTEGEIILASNLAQDLTNLVVAYLEIYKQYAQGVNGVRVPTGRYTVVFRKMTESGMLPVKIVCTKTITWEEPEYYDVDSDYFSEGFGANNVSGHRHHSEDHIEECDIIIPYTKLLLSREAMVDDVTDLAAREKKKAEEQFRLNEIERHEAALAKLKRGMSV